MNASLSDLRHFAPVSDAGSTERRRCRNCGDIVAVGDVIELVMSTQHLQDTALAAS